MPCNGQCWTHAEDAEEYLLGHLNPEANLAVRKHLAICRRCREIANEASQVIEAIRRELGTPSYLPDHGLLGRPFLERRRLERISAGLSPATIIDANGKATSVLLLDITESGALVEMEGDMAVGTAVFLDTSSMSVAAQVRHAASIDGSTVFGVSFLTPPCCKAERRENRGGTE